jgi:glycosyltransferase involved in cell wall biosynthesis
MKKTLDISVIIPSKDYGRFIAEAIESVLNQTLSPKEIIVIDDGSKDDTSRVVAAFGGRVKYYMNEKRGLGAARNLGIRISTGHYIAHLDADDIWMPKKLELQMEEFIADPDLEITGGMMQPFFSSDMSPGKKKKIYCSPVPLPGFSASVILVKRGSFIRVGHYREDIPNGTDLDWFLRAREALLREKMVKAVLAYRRLHTRNSSAGANSNHRDRLAVLKESLDRKRGRE